MLAASLQDLDGIGLLISQALCLDYHHLLGHNLCYGLVLSALLVYFSHHRLKAFLLYLALFHLHLILDYYGSGPDWGIAYAWPVSSWSIMNAHAWPFYAWQNVATGYFFVGWTCGILLMQKRTFLEWPMPSLDSQRVALGQKLRNKLWRERPPP